MSEFQPFVMERMMSKFEQDVDYNLSESGVHPMLLSELLADHPGGVEELLATDLNYPHVNGTPELRANIAALYDGGQPSARALRLAPHIDRFSLPRQAFLDILDGVEMDLDRSRYATWDELHLYCRRVASAVGLLCIEIFGHRNPRSRDYAVELGVALQLTNILRDLHADARRGRIYLPTEDLERFGVSEEEILAGRSSDRLRELMAFQCQRARGHFFRADNVLPREDRMALYAAEIMGRIYLRLLERIEERGFDVWAERVTISRFRKALIAFSIWFKYKLLGGAG